MSYCQIGVWILDVFEDLCIKYTRFHMIVVYMIILWIAHYSSWNVHNLNSMYDYT